MTYLRDKMQYQWHLVPKTTEISKKLKRLQYNNNNNNITTQNQELDTTTRNVKTPQYKFDYFIELQ